MKKVIFGLTLTTMFIGTMLFADVSLNKKHKGMKKDGQKINCVYCHKKAGNPKDGKEFAKYQKGKFCKGSGCH